MNLAKGLPLVLAAVILVSCNVYRKFDSSAAPAAAVSDTSQKVELPTWRDFFKDPVLKDLIDTALSRNTDLAVAQVRIRQAQINFQLSKGAYIPEINIGYTGNLGKSPANQISSGLSWSYGSPGYLFARRHRAEALAYRAEDVRDSIKAALISQVAAAYYRLQMLDEEIAIYEQTDVEWTRSLNTQQSLLPTGKVLYNSVAQMESMLLDVHNDMLEAKAEIADLERTICLLCDMPIRQIKRTEYDKACGIPVICDGVPMGNLENRPDVRCARRDIESAFYLTSEARSQLYPALTITAVASWPEVLSATMNLLQPVLKHGSIIKGIELSEMDEEAVRLEYTHTLLNAGSEVYKALCDYKLYSEKCELYGRQVEIQNKACNSVNALAGNGKAGYLDIIKASEKLLDARTDLCEARYSQNTSLINLFRSVGGF